MMGKKINNVKKIQTNTRRSSLQVDHVKVPIVSKEEENSQK